MSALIEENPAYREVTIIRVDWDEHSDSNIIEQLKIPRRSTLVMFDGGKEIGRVVAQTGKAPIGELFESVIAAQ